MLLNPVAFHSPRTIKEAVQLYGLLEDVKILAGGTFLLNSLKLLKRKGTKTTANIISLRKIDELKGIRTDGKQLIVPAMTIINDLFESPLLVENFAILRTVCRNISTNPIRNMATVGGNLTCRYTWTEMGAVMIALNAQMHFTGKDGEKTVVSAEEFFKNAAKSDKLFTHVTIDRDPSARLAYRRVKKTMHVDVPLLAICVKVYIKDGKFSNSCVSINNGTSFAQRDYQLESFLNASASTPEMVNQAMDHLDVNIYDKRSDEYKSHMFRVSIKNALLEVIKSA
jgi:CO/xanthine dehydrogenase FAD-binding subunit